MSHCCKKSCCHMPRNAYGYNNNNFGYNPNNFYGYNPYNFYGYNAYNLYGYNPYNYYGFNGLYGNNLLLPYLLF